VFVVPAGVLGGAPSAKTATLTPEATESEKLSCCALSWVGAVAAAASRRCGSADSRVGEEVGVWGVASGQWGGASGGGGGGGSAKVLPNWQRHTLSTAARMRCRVPPHWPTPPEPESLHFFGGSCFNYGLQVVWPRRPRVGWDLMVRGGGAAAAAADASMNETVSGGASAPLTGASPLAATRTKKPNLNARALRRVIVAVLLGGADHHVACGRRWNENAVVYRALSGGAVAVAVDAPDHRVTDQRRWHRGTASDRELGRRLAAPVDSWPCSPAYRSDGCSVCNRADVPDRGSDEMAVPYVKGHKGGADRHVAGRRR